MATLYYLCLTLLIIYNKSGTAHAGFKKLNFNLKALPAAAGLGVYESYHTHHLDIIIGKPVYRRIE